MAAKPRRLARWLGVLALVAALWLIIAAFTLSSWSEVSVAEPHEAGALFDEALAAAGSRPAYVEIAADGDVSVRRELESLLPVKLKALHVLAWRSQDGATLEMGLPWWFVRLKMNETINLGPLIFLLQGEWPRLDVSVSDDDLELYGPGLVLDHTTQDRTRILLWTEAP